MSEFRLTTAGIQNIKDIPAGPVAGGELTPFVSKTVSGAATATIDDSERKPQQSKLKFCLGLGAVLCGFLCVHALGQIILALIVLF